MIETDHLILRRPVPGDWEAFRAFFQSDRSSTLGGPRTLGETWRIFAAELGHWEIRGYGMWTVLRRGDEVPRALVGPWVPADWPETEIGWMVYRAEDEGTGLATEAARAAVDHAWRVLKWDTIVSYIGFENDRSAALAEKLGAVLDPDAPQPHPDKRCRVYRHPRPEDL